MDCYDIIIQAGQSNAEGCGKGPVENEYVPSPEILYLDSVKTVEWAPDHANGVIVTYADEPFRISEACERSSEEGPVGDFSLTFARKYVDHQLLPKGRKLLIIRAAIGATGFKCKNWGMDCQLYLKMLEMIDYALNQNPENRLVAFLWHQGEHDAARGTAPDDYKTYMADLLRSVRERYNVPQLPFVAGDFVHHWKNMNIDVCAPIVEKLRDLCKEVGYASFAESEGLLSNDQKHGNGDSIHFCRQSLHELGERYFDAFQKAKARV